MTKKVRDRQEVCDTKCKQQGELRTEHSRKKNNKKNPTKTKRNRDSEMVRGGQMHKERKTDKERQNDE